MIAIENDVFEASQHLVDTVHGLENHYCMVEMKRDKISKTVTSATSHFGTYDQHSTRQDSGVSPQTEFYMVVAQAEGHSTKVDSIVRSWAVAVDFDNGLPDICQVGGPLQPNLLVETSPDRFHAVYAMEAALTPNQMGRLAKALAARLGGDMAMARGNQMIRMPGGTNWKYGCKVIERTEFRLGKPYTYRFLWKACDADLYEASVKMHLPAMNHTSKSPLKDAPDTVVKHVGMAAQYLAELGYADEYDTWRKVLVNLVPLGENGRQVALTFSRSSTKFDQHEFDRKWLDCCKCQTGAASTLFAIAQREGWKNPGWSKSSSGTSNGPPDERAFGVTLAHEVSESLAAIELATEGRKAKPVIFLRWNGHAYEALDERQKRTEIAKAAASVIESNQWNGGGYEWKKFRDTFGKNRGLDSCADHVAEVLIPYSVPRVVGTHPYLPVKNGVLNLLTGELVPADYQPIPTQVCPVEYDPTATAPRFMQFLQEILEHDEEMISFILRLLSYPLLGLPREQKLFIFLGPSENGKSTLLDIVNRLLGGFGGLLETETLIKKSHVHDGAKPALAKLTGKRFVVASEPNADQKFDVSLVKQITGESAIPVRGLYSDGIDQVIQFVCFMSANGIPFASSKDTGMWRRLVIVPFKYVIPAGKVDLHLVDRLMEESSGILNLLLGGLADYFKNGLMRPNKVIEATKAVRQDADSFAVFLRACCEEVPLARSYLRDLWGAYQSWSTVNPKFPQLTKSEFQSAMATEFQEKSQGNLPLYIGVKLTSV